LDRNGIEPFLPNDFIKPRRASAGCASQIAGIPSDMPEVPALQPFDAIPTTLLPCNFIQPPGVFFSDSSRFYTGREKDALIPQFFSEFFQKRFFAPENCVLFT
jgi:hypothetical protein